MNTLDKQYTDLLQDILDNGITKKDRTGTGTRSVFGRQIRHKMSDGFPLLTTKKMYTKGIITELLWFLRGDTNIKYLVDNDCNIWNGDAYKNYTKTFAGHEDVPSMEWFVNEIKNNSEFAEKFGDLGPIYGKQWRDWHVVDLNIDPQANGDSYHVHIDQIKNLINDLKNNPDSRRLMVNAWNVAEIDKAVLPPCHYGFQCWTRELTSDERVKLFQNKTNVDTSFFPVLTETLEFHNIPKRTISLMWNQRSVDTFLGLPFNIASYGLLLEMIAKEVNMVPDELIANLGDTHIYLNHIEQAKEQIGREITAEEIIEHLQESGMDALMDEPRKVYIANLPKRTREPYPLPKLSITEHDGQTYSLLGKLYLDNFQIQNYQSHSSIKAALSN